MPYYIINIYLLRIFFHAFIVYSCIFFYRFSNPGRQKRLREKQTGALETVAQEAPNGTVGRFRAMARKFQTDVFRIIRPFSDSGRLSKVV